MTFAYPGYFWLLLLVPVFIYFHFWREYRRRSDFRYPDLRFLRAMRPSWRLRLRHLPFVLHMAAMILIVVTLARPQAHDREEKKTSEGIDIILCLDTSTSMAAEDLKPNRIEAAKVVAKEFVEGRQTDRIGLVPFAAQSFTQCPLTTDYLILLSLLADIHMRMVEDGTAIGMAMGTAINRLRESTAKSKVVILLTDGQNNRGELDPVTAAQAAAALGIKIYTIGAGTRGLAPYPVETIFGVRYQKIPVDIDEDMLREIARVTGARYYRATDEKKLREIYHQIDQLERSKVEVTEYRHVAELYSPWLAGALVCLLLEIALASTRF
ncbi:MAG: VWA domain-containing protein, partial [bacterium]